MSAEVLPATLLSRKAVVYVRQSTQTQVQTNLESKRRQYDLVEAARRHGGGPRFPFDASIKLRHSRRSLYGSRIRGYRSTES